MKKDIEYKINELIANMTLKEKIGQCNMIEPFFLFDSLNKTIEVPFTNMLDERFIDKLLNDYHIGFLLFGGISSLGNDTAEMWASFINKINQYNKNSTRLQIPLFFGVDAVHGVNFVKGSTIFSHNLGVVSSWNLDLAKEYAFLVAKELETIGINVNFAPTVDVARDQRWGRVYESLGEDPYLAAKMSEALVKGMQETTNLAACAKHFVGYGEAFNGMDRTPADLSERSLWENHIPPFKSAIDAGVKTIMVSGGDVNGTPMPSSKKLMTDVLRKKLGFEGLILSDWDDVYRLYKHHHIAKNKEEAIMKAFNAGLDLNMMVADVESLEIMERLVNENKISLERLNETVRRVLRVKYEMGMFEKEDIDINKAIEFNGNYDSKVLGKQVALESLTLLKNESKLLPLSKTVKSILLTGKTASSKNRLCGGWTLGWDVAKEEDLDFLTIEQALRLKVPNCKITYVKDIFELNQVNFNEEGFDLCISVVGETPHSEWLGDSYDLAIEKEEMDLLKAAKATNLPLVMVSVIGRPVNMIWANDNVEAILWAYLPGSFGADAIADCLFGDYNPSGKLPISFPKDGNQIPVVYNARRYTSGAISTKYEPLYPFGYGLSYTEFEYMNLQVPEKIKLNENCHVSLAVKNIGNLAGEEIVQLYLQDQYASVTRPLKSLKGFKKINLQPNEQKTVSFILTKEDLSLYDEDLNFIEEKRMIEIQIGNLNKIIELVDENINF